MCKIFYPKKYKLRKELENGKLNQILILCEDEDDDNGDNMLRLYSILTVDEKQNNTFSKMKEGLYTE